MSLVLNVNEILKEHNSPKSPSMSLREASLDRIPCIKQKFSPEEDEKLKLIVQKYGESNWKRIADHMGTRNCRQCRERWKNYLSPKVCKDPWSREEEALLIEKFNELGSQWSVMAKFFPKRTDVNLKNHWVVMARHALKSADKYRENYSQYCAKDDIVLYSTQSSSIHEMNCHKIAAMQSILMSSNNSLAQCSLRNAGAIISPPEIPEQEVQSCSNLNYINVINDVVNNHSNTISTPINKGVIHPLEVISTGRVMLVDNTDLFDYDIVFDDNEISQFFDGTE
ncbi:hypothetical protein TRFO_25800 [Tritrichomonas foetus]|uniref:Myb-like DNA-binding domain containing protein n=1 Tax=Tritrichomonas foetus TaxID=1144522 RepID=A0A1J4K9R3_9EUKA|nr:hypothetical protein TRFO_25800 [Tritrichomonas foetus]|eukprot:OHT06189.1 hypothetical protein TRFO_25800 [Tritrichomonas foetus]